MSVPGPMLGPCVSWINGDDVADCCTVGSSNATLAETMAIEASMALYEISGRRFSGLCDRLVRPCRTGADCWGNSPVVGSWGPWYWSWDGSAVGIGWGWRNEAGPLCGCRPLSTVRLAGYPVREIVEVKIDGVVLDLYDSNGYPNYRLDGWRELVRMDDPTTGARRFWPACQNLALDDTESGTFSVAYRWGIDPPELGRQAAAELACQLMLSCPGSDGEECVIQEGVTRVERQGITIDRQVLAGFLDPTKPTGLVALDTFMAAYARIPRTRVPAVWSPDI